MARDESRSGSGTSLQATARLLYIVAGVGIALDADAFFQYAAGSQERMHALLQLPANLAILLFGFLVGRGKRWAVVAGLVAWGVNTAVSWFFWHGVVALVLAVVVAYLIARPLLPASEAARS